MGYNNPSKIQGSHGNPSYYGLDPLPNNKKKTARMTAETCFFLVTSGIPADLKLQFAQQINPIDLFIFGHL